ncbi:MAG: DUF427 domain-containing protein [Myxococcota bacterium]|nr:DUF427 domain-containing protein [Myxococcota bacterium]
MARLPDDLDAERRRWRSFRRGRPAEREPVGPGEESVWDYPRPPRLERARRRVRIEFGGQCIAESTRALRVCETASPPVYYVPAEDVRRELLEESAQQSFCEWKGVARYWTLRVGDAVSVDAAWSYPNPDAPFEALRDHLAFYPGRVEAAWLDDERVRPQAGDFYGGWVTDEIKGPFKGDPGTGHW